eukprot:GFUD01016093.1.p1 GENE.GFUD01016093.1~~GFUD01016093.1.p1  ORF type:complete len:800 (+),score=220.63 GFUD01016093.1:61-2460(+)
MAQINNDEVEIAVEESTPEPFAKANGGAPVIEEVKVDIVNENGNGSDIETSEKAVENIEEMEGSDAVEVDTEREADRDSLVPGTGSINGDIEGGYDDESDEGEEDIDDEDENMSNVVQGTTETILNKLEENLAQAPEVDESDLLQVAEPGPLDSEGKDIEQVLSIISNSIYREGEGQIFSKLCDRSALLSVVSHSLSAYITTLESVPLQRLSSRIASEVSMWMCDLFNFPGGLAHCHDDIREGLVRTVRMVLHDNYPDLATEGFLALTPAPPVLYITSSTYAEVAQYVCTQLGLPSSTIRYVSPNEEDVTGFESFQKALDADKEAGKTPLMCIANVHSTIFQKQTVTKLQELCKTNNLWLHLEGHALSALTLLPSQGDQTLAQRGDSMTLTFGSWVGIPSVPFVTLYRNDTPAAQIAGLGVVNPAVRLGCLPLWCVLRSLGQNQIRARIRGVFQMLEDITERLKSLTCLRLLSQTGDRTFAAVSGLETGDVDPSEVFHTVSPALAFQYVSDCPPDLSERVPPYTDNLNSWLGQILQRDAPHIPVEIVDVETTGYVLRLCPFEDVAMVGLAPEDVESFLQCVEEKCAILNATVTQRTKFMELIELEPSVQHVDIAHWAGLGGVRYIPFDYIDRGSEKILEMTEDDLKMVNQRNMELVATLRNTDSAFSLGEGPPPDHVMCVRFGMVTMETEVEELLTLVINCGKDIDEAVNQLQSMSEVVKNGVKQAQEELRKEADNQIWQEGILRHVPIVGSFYNWLSPVPDEAKAKGRYLNLQEGKLETTDKIYKHHMQIHIEDGQEL